MKENLGKQEVESIHECGTSVAVEGAEQPEPKPQDFGGSAWCPDCGAAIGER